MISRFRSICSRIASVFRHDRLDQDFNDELAAHLEMLTEENRKSGMSPEQALRAARLKIGGLEAAKELHRDSRSLPLFETLFQDFRYTIRTLRRDTGFALFAVLILGLGIGAGSTVFSVVNTILLRPLPFQAPDKLVWITNTDGEGMSGASTRVANFQDWRQLSQSFEDLAGYLAFYGTGDHNLIGQGEPERLSGVQVTQNFFDLLGVTPALGRVFTPEEAKWHGSAVVLLSHELWERRFTSDPGIIGRKLILNDSAATVIGVLPASFNFATVFSPNSKMDLYFPFPLGKETDRWGNSMAVIGRLKPGVALQTAQAEMNVIRRQLMKAHPERGTTWGAQLAMLQDHVSGPLRNALLVLACAVGVVMLIVCANLSNLLLARAATRQKEIAIRTALGAGRARLIRQMLTESMVLSGCGVALGLLLAYAATKMLAGIQTISIPLLRNVQLDGVALGFTVAVGVITGFVFGLVPALHVSRAGLHDALKENGRGSSEGAGRVWIRSALVVSEVALACVLLVGAGLLIHSFLRVLDVDLGFQPARAAAIRVDPGAGYSDFAKRDAYFNEVLARAKAVPGIDGAGLTDVLPLGRNRSWGAGVKGRIYTPENYPSAFVRIVSEGYLQAMGIPLRAGRDFTARDTNRSEKVMLINETMARMLWPGEDPIGQKINNNGDVRVVGIVGDVRHIALESGSGPEMYYSMRQTGDYDSVDLVVRTKLPPAALASSVRTALGPVAPNLPLSDFRTLDHLVDRAASPRRFVVMLLGGFAFLALVLASLGIYGLISYSVNQRTQEIGIRMALGASAGRVQLSIFAQTIRLVVLGVVIGSIGATVMGRSLGAMLYGVTSGDPATYFATVAALVCVAGLAGYLPARRASRIDPMVALRAA